MQEPGSCAVELCVDEAVEIVEGAGVLLPLDVLVTRVRPQGQRHRDPVINLLHHTITVRRRGQIMELINKWLCGVTQIPL